MTSLAIAEPSPASHGSSTGEESLLENAIWFPDIPESSLRWNESCFTATEDLTTGFRPLCYVLFKDITRVTAFWSIGGLLAIDFQDVAGNVRRLGPHSLDFRDHSKAHFHLNSREGEKVIRIDIHKKERFNSVEVSNYLIICKPCLLIQAVTLAYFPILRSDRFLPIEGASNSLVYARPGHRH